MRVSTINIEMMIMRLATDIGNNYYPVSGPNNEDRNPGRNRDHNYDTNSLDGSIDPEFIRNFGAGAGNRVSGNNRPTSPGSEFSFGGLESHRNGDTAVTNINRRLFTPLREGVQINERRNPNPSPRLLTPR